MKIVKNEAVRIVKNVEAELDLLAITSADRADKFAFQAVVKANASESVTEAVSFIAYRNMTITPEIAEAIAARRLMLFERMQQYNGHNPLK